MYRLRYDERIRKQVGKEKVDAVVNAILRSPFYQSLELAAAGNEALLEEVILIALGAPSFISNEDKTDMGVESAPFVSDVFARRETFQDVENELAYREGRTGSRVPNSPVVVQSNPTTHP